MKEVAESKAVGLPKSMQVNACSGKPNAGILCLDSKVGSAKFVFLDIVLKVISELSGNKEENSLAVVDIGGNAFYCVPTSQENYDCTNTMNYAEGFLSERVLGIVATLIALSRLSFAIGGDAQEKVIKAFHDLRSKVLDELDYIAYEGGDDEEAQSASEAARMIIRFTD